MAKRDELINRFEVAEERRPKPDKKIVQPQVPNADAATGAQAQTAQGADDNASTENKKDAEAKQGHSRPKHKKKGFRHFIRTFRSIIQDKTLNKMLNVFLICLIINALEYFVLINRFGIVTKGAIGKLIGAGVIFYYMYKARLKPHNVGLSSNKRAVWGGIKNAVIFNTALIPAYMIEIFILSVIKKQDITLTVFAYTANYSSVGPIYWAANILLLVIINLVSALMLEILFRGILMKMGKSKFGFWQTSVIVSVFYAIWYLLIPLSKVIIGVKPYQLISLCVFYLLFEFAVSMKWCMCSRATGSIWLSFFDHFIFTTAVGLVRVVNLMPNTVNNVDPWRNYRLILIQVISFILCFIYYKKKMRRKERLLQEAGVHSIYAFDSLADMSEDDVKRQAGRIKTADGEIDSEYLRHIERLKNGDRK